MSDDLDGRQAFEHVVDRLIEEGRNRALDIEKRKDSETATSDMRRQLEAARSDLSRVKAELAGFTGANDAIEKLYDAVELAIRRLALTPEDAELVVTLRAGMAGAKKFIDPIPF